MESVHRQRSLIPQHSAAEWRALDSCALPEDPCVP